MKQILLLLIFFCLRNPLLAQYVYTIKADSVKITDCDSSELIIENHTQGVPGFLFNKGRGRTEFRRAVLQLDDTTLLVGGDTLRASFFSLWKRNANHIYNINSGNVGIHRSNPNVMLDLPGPVNIDDSTSYRINYHPVLRVADLETVGYTNLYAGDSSGVNNSGIYNTLIGSRAGINNGGSSGTFLGYAAGHDSQGDNNTFLGSNSGQNNSPDDVSGRADENSFFGAGSGQYSSGFGNTFLGANSGTLNYGINNMFIGDYAGQNSEGSDNIFLGGLGGVDNAGNGNIFLGPGSGSFNNGDNNILIGQNSGGSNIGYRNVFVGLNTGQYNQGTDNTFIGNGAGFEQGYGNGIKENYLTLVGSGAIVRNIPNIINATAIGANAIAGISNTMVFGDTAVNTWFFNSRAVVTTGAAMIVGSDSTNGNGAYLSKGGVWTNASDRSKKENFQLLNADEILEKINSLSISRWNYKGFPDQHIGPVAQDFYRVFRLGCDDKTISTIDPSGVALVGIQGLYGKYREAERQFEDQRSLIREQQSLISDMQSRLQQQAIEIAAQQTKMNQLLEEFKSLKTTFK